jgi:hypothetical protein
LPGFGKRPGLPKIERKMKVKMPEKFAELYEIYIELPGANRQERYNIAERIYQDRNGEKAYDDFRKFGALLNIYYSSEVPHSSSVAFFQKGSKR